MLAHASAETDTLTSCSLLPHHVRIAVEDVVLSGELVVPPGAVGAVVCLGPRSECVARFVREHDNATLRIELLSAQERREDELTHGLRFNIGLLAQRLIGVTRWLAQQPATAGFGFGYFGENMTGAVALAAAGELGVVVDAVVCRHARIDFAANSLPRVEASTLLICGNSDTELIGINRASLTRLQCEKQLQIVQQTRDARATDKDCVGCELAAQWFKSYLRPR